VNESTHSSTEPKQAPASPRTDRHPFYWLATAALLVAMFAHAQEILVPLALAVVISFALSPLVKRWERYLGRGLAVALVMFVAISAVAGFGYLLKRQLVDLSDKVMARGVFLQDMPWGVAFANLLHGNSIETYSSVGYDYAVEKAGSTVGWSFTIYEEIWNYGFVQEMAHFVDCVKNDKQPLVTGEDARTVLEVIFAAYQSAGTGRKVLLPFKTDAAKPIDLWKK